MKLVVLERAFSPELAAPVTLNDWMQINHTLDACLESRQVNWLYSLVSVNGDRSICLFHAPYAETVREACRQARMPFQTVWQADWWRPEAPQSFTEGDFLIVVEANYDPPITQAIVAEIKHQTKGCLSELNIESVFSVLTLDGKHSACTFSASSAEQVRSLYRRVGMSFEHIWKASLLQPISTELTSTVSQ